MPVHKVDETEISIKNLPWKISFIVSMVFTIFFPWSVFISLLILGKKNTRYLISEILQEWLFIVILGLIMLLLVGFLIFNFFF